MHSSVYEPLSHLRGGGGCSGGRLKYIIKKKKDFTVLEWFCSAPDRDLFLIQADLYRLTCISCPVPLSFPGCPVLAVLPWLSCPSCLVLALGPCCHVLAVKSTLAKLTYPF